MLKYGLLTASGKDGGRAGVKVDCADVTESKQLSVAKNDRCIVNDEMRRAGWHQWSTWSGVIYTCRVVVLMSGHTERPLQPSLSPVQG